MTNLNICGNIFVTNGIFSCINSSIPTPPSLFPSIESAISLYYDDSDYTSLSCVISILGSLRRLRLHR